MNSESASTDSATQERALCGVCPAGCRANVSVRGDQIVGIEPDSSEGLSMMCRRGMHAPEIVHSPNRLTTPLRRIGPKGTYDFEPCTWDQAYDLIVDRLEKIKRESGPEAVCVYTGRGAFEQSLCDMYRPKGVAVSSASNVLFRWGSPNTTGVGALCYVAYAKIAPHTLMGRVLVQMYYDYGNADLLVVWGANPATDSPPLKLHLIQQAQEKGAQVVAIDPRRTETIDRTQAQWLPIRPGTDGALALAMIQVVIEEELYDHEFASKWCHGFDELARYVREFPPERVAEITRIPAAEIRQLARRIATAKSACPVMYTGLEYSNSGVQAIRAVFTLFALTGHLDQPGGICLKMRNASFPVNRSCNVQNPDIDRAIGREIFPMYSRYRDESHASRLVDAVLDHDPYPIRGLLVQGASLLTSWPQTAVWRETLSKLDFIACIDRQLTADAAYADVVLPATTMFENLSYQVFGSTFRLRERVIPPVGEARNDYLIMAELAARLGYGEQYPQTEEALLRFALDGSGYSLEDVRAAGGAVTVDAPAMAYKKWETGQLRADGAPGFETPTGKFEIWSTTLEDEGYAALPEYVEPTEGPLASPEVAQKYPLVFNSGARTQYDFRSQHHGIPGLARDLPRPQVQLHPLDARSRGIRDRDIVVVRTPRAAVPFEAVVTDRILEGTVECNMGGGTPVGSKEWNLWNVNELTDLGNFDPISGFPVYKALLCEVELAGDSGGV